MGLKEITPIFLRAISRMKRDKKHFRRLPELNIEAIGKTSEGVHWVKLKNGLKFHGYPSDKVQQFIFNNYLKPKQKKGLEAPYLNIALDIIKRYLEYQDPKRDMDFRFRRFQHIKPGDSMVEAGAFTGFYVMNVAEKVGPTGQVLAIEAVPENFEILKLNVEANNLHWVKLINKAVFNEATTLSFYRTQKQIGSTFKDIVQTEDHLKVPANTLPKLMEEAGMDSAKFIRLQLNGTEFTALQAMDELLEQSPYMLIAAPYSLNGQKLSDVILNYLREKNQECWWEPGNVFVVPKS